MIAYRDCGQCAAPSVHFLLLYLPITFIGTSCFNVLALQRLILQHRISFFAGHTIISSALGFINSQSPREGLAVSFTCGWECPSHSNAILRVLSAFLIALCWPRSGTNATRDSLSIFFILKTWVITFFRPAHMNPISRFDCAQRKIVAIAPDEILISFKAI